MVTTILSDEVINSTELRNNLPHWFEKAYINPVSIMSGKKKLVLLNREYAKNLYKLNDYARLVVQFCEEQNIGQSKRSDAFPWVKYLDEKTIVEFHKELLSTFSRALRSGDSSILEEMIDDWKATAEVESNPNLARAILAEEDSSKYVEIKD